MFELFRAVTPLVEPLSMDEAYLDVTENAWNEPLGVNVARRLKQQVREATQLTISAGVAPNKFLAKIASGWKKPDGLTVIAPERMEDFLQKLPVDALWGVGPKTATRLRAAGIERLVDVRDRTTPRSPRSVGCMAGWLRALANGVDERRVEPHRDAKSSGSERTYTEDLSDLGTIQSEVAKMAEGAARWLEKRETLARTVTLKMRYKDFRTITRSPLGAADARRRRRSSIARVRLRRQDRRRRARRCACSASASATSAPRRAAARAARRSAGCRSRPDASATRLRTSWPAQGRRRNQVRGPTGDRRLGPRASARSSPGLTKRSCSEAYCRSCSCR